MASNHAAFGGGNTPTVVNITSVKVDSNSVKVDFAPVPGAKDYRIYDISNPNDIKYAGIWHLDADSWGQWSSVHFAVDSSGNFIQPLQVVQSRPALVPGEPWTSPDFKYHHADIPATEIEFNGLTPGQPTTLVVEAVDSTGPASYMCLYDQNNNRIFPLDADCDPSIGECALGSNMGCTWWADQQNLDVMTTNGQGDYHNEPNVIAQSQPFVVTADGIGPIPDTNLATQAFCDTFASGTFTAPTNMNIQGGTEQYTLTTPAGVWDVQTDTADIRDSSSFVHKGHLMDVLFDGSTPGSNNPLHIAHGVFTFSPEQTVDFSGGKILHVTMEVDAHTDSRRWVGINLAPANDPLVHWYGTALQINNSDTAFFAQFQDSVALADEFVGPTPSGTPNDVAIAGPLGGAMMPGFRQFVNYQYGHGLDDRSRFDLFISTTHFAVYEDGTELYEYDLPVTLPFSKAKVYFTGYLYHSALEQQEVAEYCPYETYWLTMFPYSDERHWDNMGFEVLPAGTSWSSLHSLITMPQPTAPTYVASGSGTILPPPPPPNLPATPQDLASTAGNAQVSLTWNSSSGATTYDIFRGTKSGNETLYQTGVTSPTWTDKGTANGTTYFYVTSANNSAGQSGMSNETSATPHTAGSVPAAPALRGQATTKQVNLTWTESTAGCTFTIYRGTTPGGEDTTPIATGVNAKSYVDRPSSMTSPHYYEVTATNANGASAMSNEVKVTAPRW